MECGECTLCCTLLDIPWMDSKAGEPCKFCDKGCTIHETKDERCSEYMCAYNQAEIASQKMRPDNCGVIFEKLEDDLMFGTINPEHKDFSFMSGQIDSFLKEGINVVVSKNGKSTTYHLDDVAPESLLTRIYKMAS